MSDTPKPVRLQLSRRKGFNLQALSLATNGLPAVSVAKPSKWGNPCRIGMWWLMTGRALIEHCRVIVRHVGHATIPSD